MDPVASFPDKKGSEDEEKISGNKLNKRIPAIINETWDKRKAYPQDGNKNNFQKNILDHASSGYGSLNQFLIRSFSCVFVETLFLI